MVDLFIRESAIVAHPHSVEDHADEDPSTHRDERRDGQLRG